MPHGAEILHVKESTEPRCPDEIHYKGSWLPDKKQYCPEQYQTN